MREQVTFLIQSRFFTPAFNGAIFDGPIRIYFSQNQEAAAMKLYFAVLSRIKNLLGDVKDRLHMSQQNIFVMIYPTSDSFRLVFPGDSLSSFQVDRLEQDHIIGLRGPVDEKDFPAVLGLLDQMIMDLSFEESTLQL